MSHQSHFKIHRRFLIKDLNKSGVNPQSDSASKFNVQVVGTVLKVFYYENRANQSNQPGRAAVDTQSSRTLESERQITYLILDDSTGVCRIDFLFGPAAMHQPYYNKPKPCPGDTIEVIGECSPSNLMATILCYGYDLLEDPLSELVCLIETAKFNKTLLDSQKSSCVTQPTQPKTENLNDLISDVNDILDGMGDLDDLFDDI